MDQIFNAAATNLKCSAANPANVIFFNEEDKEPAKIAFVARIRAAFSEAYLAYQVKRAADIQRAKTALVEREQLEREFIQAVLC